MCSSNLPGAALGRGPGKLNRIDEGTYGVVYRACDVETGEAWDARAITGCHMSKRDGLSSCSTPCVNVWHSFVPSQLAGFASVLGLKTV